MVNAPENTITLLFERIYGGRYTGYVEEMPNMIRVEGETLSQVRLSLFVQVAQLFSELPHPENIKVTTKVRLKINVLQE